MGNQVRTASDTEPRHKQRYRFVTPLHDIDADCVAQCGAKADKVARMLQAGLQVPDGFCIPTAAFRCFLRTLDGSEPLLARLEKANPEDIRQVQQAAERVRRQLESLPIPQEVQAEILVAWRAQDSDRGWAVRSSATAEDLLQASFAGQHDTFLNVRSESAFLNAVRGCWVSLFSDRAVLYRMRHRIPHSAVEMAILVQAMVPADVAGVLFTANPATGDPNRVVIEAAYGLGEALVGGKVCPDRLVLCRDTLRVVEQQINRKSVKIVLQEGGGVCQRDVETGEQEQPCLSDALIQRLGEEAQAVERLFTGPQDIEWAASDGRVFLLQSRPITALKRQEEEDRTVWSNLAVGEVMPDVVTPLTWSVLESLMIERFMKPVLRRLDIHLDETPLFKLIAGRVYLNVGTVAQLLRSLPFMGRIDIGEALGGHQGALGSDSPNNLIGEESSLNLRRLVRLLALLVWFLVHSTRRSGDALVAGVRRRLDELAATDVSGMSDEELAHYIPALLERCGRITGDPSMGASLLGNVGVGFGCVTAVFGLSRRWLKDEDGSLASRLISGTGDMDSAEAGLQLWRLTAWTRQHPRILQILLPPGPFAAAEIRLQALPEGREFLLRWRDFMLRHGHHTRGEVDIHNPRWSEMPDHVLGMVRGYLGLEQKADPLARQADLKRQRQGLLADCRRRLGNPLKWWAFNFLLHKGRHGLAVRENCKSEFARMVAVLRRALLEAGRRCVQKRALQARDDVFFLNHNELQVVLTGGAAFDVAGTIAPRKAEYALNQSLLLPPVIVGRFDSANPRPELVAGKCEVLKGLAVSAGVATGRARVILRADTEERVHPGEILVAPLTDPGWTPDFIPAAAIVMELGGQLTHGSILAREYGIPAVANVGSATRFIKTGQVIQVDGNRGVVTVIPEERPAEETRPRGSVLD